MKMYVKAISAYVCEISVMKEMTENENTKEEEKIQ
jgi:hypothetical protein